VKEELPESKPPLPLYHAAFHARKRGERKKGEGGLTCLTSIFGITFTAGAGVEKEKKGGGKKEKKERGRK